MIVQVHHYFHFDSDESGESKQLLKQLLSIVTQNTQILKEIKMTDQEVSDLLDQVNTTTNGIAANVTANTTTLGTVKTELEALLAQPPSVSGLTPETSAKLQAFVATLGSVKDNVKTNTDVLNAIAAEGANTTQIPAPPPPPPAPPA